MPESNKPKPVVAATAAATPAAADQNAGADNSADDNQQTPEAKPVDAPKQESKIVQAPGIGISTAPPKAQMVDEKKVKIRALVDHTCRIGFQTYAFAENQEYPVPKSVAAVLQHAKKAIVVGY